VDHEASYGGENRMTDKYQCHITINNRSTSHLVFSKSDLLWGEFIDGNSPVKDIPPKIEVPAFKVSGAPWGAGGPEGTVTYVFQDDENIKVEIYFNVPLTPGMPNSVTARTTNSDVAATVDGLIGEGATEACTIKVIDGR
jgi:hypothetical protein